MGRLGVALATIAAVVCGVVGPAAARPATSPADAVTGGRVTFALDFAANTMTSTFSGQFAAGGRVYSGTASGTSVENDPYAMIIAFSGTSSTGSISATCYGSPSPYTTALPMPSNVGGQPTPEILEVGCSVAIDGQPNAPLDLYVAVEQTDTSTYKGVFGATPDAHALPTVPVISYGTATADLYQHYWSSLGFGFSGQITIGTQTFRGDANGGSSDFQGLAILVPVLQVPPFALTGTSATGTLSATCSGLFAYSGVALSVFSCNGSVNGGSPGPLVLVSAYAITSVDQNLPPQNEGFSGVFAGL